MAPDYRGSGKLEGFAAIVTGGDSGIGRAVAVLFAREGADVAIAYLDEHDDADETQRCVEAEGRRCLLLAGDVKDAAFCADASSPGPSRPSAGSTSLVNNAAFQEHADSIEDITDERLDETLPHQHLRLLPHGAGGAAAPEATARRSSTPARSPA